MFDFTFTWKELANSWNHWSFRKTGTMGTLESRAEIGVRVHASTRGSLLEVGMGIGRPSRSGQPGVLHHRIFF